MDHFRIFKLILLHLVVPGISHIISSNSIDTENTCILDRFTLKLEIACLKRPHSAPFFCMSSFNAFSFRQPYE